MQSITPNLKFILGWLKSPLPWRSEVCDAGECRHPGDGQGPSYRWKTVSSLKDGMDPGFHRGDDKARLPPE